MQQESDTTLDPSVTPETPVGAEAPAEPAPTEAAGISAEQLAELEEKARENWERALRLQAEMDNLRRRTQKDLENAHKFALESFVKDLLPVLDSLELGLYAATGDSDEVAKFREGTELTLKQFYDVLSRHQIEVIDPAGQPFNPEWHQAMSMQPSAEHAPNTVITVFQKGYSLNSRLIRPAMVVVSQPTQDAEPKIDTQA
ncbi:MAG: nucleotide exchange factor GrpE [Methylococcales bacterium]|nr:nucleotide exchange factor GrpE [Methylococcales bacterium]